MKNQMTRRGVIVLAAIMFTFGMVRLSGQNVGEAAPDFEVNLLGGDTFKLSDQKGKVVLLFFFGNNCSLCKAAGPKIESSLYQAFIARNDFVALGLDTWAGSGESSVTGFKKSAGITFPLAMNASSVASNYGTQYDRLAVIDRDGVLAHKGLIGASNDVNNALAAINASLMVAAVSDKDIPSVGLKVFPIPASDVVHFETKKNILGIRIYDASGRLVLEDVAGPTTKKRSLQLESLKRGLYLYSLQIEGGVSSGKLLIQR